MRCAQCGTENAPDSRFCGGCGAAVSVSRQAPTVKISDDAPIAAPTSRPSTAQHVSFAPPSMPPMGGQAGLTTKPGGHAAPPRPSAQNLAAGPLSGQHDSISPTAHLATPVPGAPLSRPPLSSQQRSPTPQASSPSLSFGAPAGRPTGLIVLLLLIDLGLAGAGVYLLMKGLQKPPAVTPAPKPEPKSDATPVEGAPTQAAGVEAPPSQGSAVAPSATTRGGTASPSAATSTGAAAAPKAGVVTELARPESSVAARAKAPASTVTATPITQLVHREAPSAAPAGSTPAATTPAATTPAAATPAATPTKPAPAPTTPAAAPTAPAPAASTPKDEIAAAYTRSQAAFDRCRGNQAISGRINVAFQVQPDGTLSHVAAVENTTGNAPLAQCLVSVIAPWRVTPFQGTTFPLFRSFNYP